MKIAQMRYQYLLVNLSIILWREKGLTELKFAVTRYRFEKVVIQLACLFRKAAIDNH